MLHFLVAKRVLMLFVGNILKTCIPVLALYQKERLKKSFPQKQAPYE
jgi:hypothetical protein